MRERAVLDEPGTLEYCLDMYKTQEMCERVFEHSWTLEYVSDQNKTKKRCVTEL